VTEQGGESKKKPKRENVCRVCGIPLHPHYASMLEGRHAPKDGFSCDTHHAEAMERGLSEWRDRRNAAMIPR